MRSLTAGLVILMMVAAPPLLRSSDKLTFDERVELTRGLTAEYATVKAFLPRSKKPLPYEASGTYDKQKWEEIGKELGPAARSGDLVQITHITLVDDKVLLEINGGLKSGKHWWDHVQVGMGSRTSPVSNGDITPTAGTNIENLYHKPLAGLQSADVKKMLAPI
ncbi:MAG: hypothetical protein JWO48_1904 [Bryobacterales bacterium]|nr:hypothetical protein [Bryobacterales bacterium]